MSDRERDLSLLETFHGSAYGILVAPLSCMSLTLVLMQYYVAGPLFREVQRLKHEIDSLSTEQKD